MRLIVYMCGWLHVLGYMRRLIDDMPRITVPEDIPHISHECPYQSHHTNVVLVCPKQADLCDIFSQRPLIWHCCPRLSRTAAGSCCEAARGLMPGIGLSDIESVGYLAAAMRRTTVCSPPYRVFCGMGDMVQGGGVRHRRLDFVGGYLRRPS
jgi:hypothetical protein